LKSLERRSEPAWLWDVGRARVVWANRAGLAFWGEATMLDLLDRRMEPSDAAVEHVAAITATLGAQTEVVESFIFATAKGPAAAEMSCRLVGLDDDRPGILMRRAGAAEAEPGSARSSLLQTVVAELPVPVLVFDRHGSLVFDNEAARAVLSANEGEAEGNLLGAWLGDADTADALIGRALAQGSLSEAMTLRTRFGPRAHRINARRIPAPVVGRMAVLMTAEDIEDRRRHERRLTEASELADTLFAAADAVFRIDVDGRLIEFETPNGAFGSGAGVLIGSLWDDAVSALEIEPGRPIAGRLAEQSPWREFLSATGGGEASRAYVVSATPVRDGEGRPDGARGLIVAVDAAGKTLASVLEEIERMTDGDPDLDDLAFADGVEDAARPAEAAGEPPRSPPQSPPGPVAEPTEPRSGPASGPETGGRVGRDDAATFSAIARALRLGHPKSEALPMEHPGGGATLRVVGGVDAPRSPGPAPAAAAETAPAPAPEPLDRDRPALLHRQFSILDATEPLARLLGHPSREALLADGNLLNLLPDERARLFSLQSRFDDNDLPESGRIAGIAMRVRRPDRTAVDVEASFEEVVVDGEPAIRVEFEPVTADAAVGAATPAAAETEVPPAAIAKSDELTAAADREKELRAIINTAADGIATIDGDGKVVTLNASAEAIFGIEAVKGVGTRFSDLFAPGSARTVEAYLQSALSSESTRLHREGHEARGRRPDGTEVPLFVTIGRMALDNGSRFCAVVRDISQWKETEEGLRLAKERAEEDSSKKSDFLARISHELRTPLNAIIGFSEVMSEEKFGPIANDRYKGYLNDIRSSGGHLLSLINDLLDLSKIEAGELDLNFTSVDVGRIIEQGVSIIQPQANRARVIVRVSLPDHLPPVVADERSLRQIVLNLLSNAVKFTPPGGQVILSAVVDDQGRLQVRVRDTGVGMTREEIARAMEPFRQIEGAAQSEFAGTGLGLPLTKALTEANRADFSIESTPSAGTLVHITVPTNRVLDG
jgi:PAS domain S-box-containing protein